MWRRPLIRSLGGLTLGSAVAIAVVLLLGGFAQGTSDGDVNYGEPRIAEEVDSSGDPSPESKACTGVNEDPNFSYFSLGSEFEGLKVTYVERRCESRARGEAIRANFVQYIYGTCDPIPEGKQEAPDGAMCAPPMAVQSWPACERSLADYESGPGVPLEHERREETRGVPEFSFDEGTRRELYAGEATIVLFSEDKALLDAAAKALRKAPDEAPSQPSSWSGGEGTVQDDLEDPAYGSLDGDLAC